MPLVHFSILIDLLTKTVVPRSLAVFAVCSLSTLIIAGCDVKDAKGICGI